MKKSLLLTLTALVFALLVVPCTVSAWSLEGGIGYWMQMPSGTLAYQGTDLSLENNLNFNDEWQPYARIKAELPLFLPNIYLMATPMEFKGTGTIPFTFGGTPFSAGAETKLTLHHYDVALYYSLPFLKTATLDLLNVEVGINARIIDFEAKVTETSTSTTVSKRLTIPVPMVYVGAQIKPFKALSIEAEARGITYGSNHYYDLIGRVKVKPYGPLFIAAGYRHEMIKIDQSDVEANVKFGGPFVELGLTF